MQFAAELLDAWIVRGCAIVALLLLGLALPGLGALRGRTERLHLLGGAAVSLALLWSIHARVDPGVAIHLLGITCVTLLLGWRLAVLAGALAMLPLALLGVVGWSMMPAGWLLSAALPAAASLAVAWLARFHLPRNPFVFIFACSFFGAGLALATTWLGAAALLAASGQPLPSGPGSSLLAFLPLVVFPEAFINGAVVSMLIVYRPGWVRLYDERFYDRFQ
jgi:uncharacterized membrane protein